jgi:hypothetical protein
MLSSKYMIFRVLITFMVLRLQKQFKKHLGGALHVKVMIRFNIFIFLLKFGKRKFLLIIWSVNLN